jgi:hypothetical protein
MACGVAWGGIHIILYNVCRPGHLCDSLPRMRLLRRRIRFTLLLLACAQQSYAPCVQIRALPPVHPPPPPVSRTPTNRPQATSPASPHTFDLICNAQRRVSARLPQGKPATRSNAENLPPGTKAEGELKEAKMQKEVTAKTCARVSVGSLRLPPNRQASQPSRPPTPPPPNP